jgi:DNA-binding IclR family transcriptional regulator
MIRAGDTGRFIASVESRQALRVGNREGMVFPAHQITGGLVLLSELSPEQMDALYAPERFADRPDERPDLERLGAELEKIRINGFALNRERSERGVVAVGHAVRDAEGAAVAGVSLSLPSVRYSAQRLPSLVAALGLTARAIEADLRVDP